MTIDEGNEGGIDLHKEDYSSFVAQTVLETSLNFTPLMLTNPVEIFSINKDKGSYTYHIIAGQMDERFPDILAHIIQMFFYHSFPFANYSLIIANEHIERTQLDHFLETDHHHISFVHGEIE